MAIPTITSIDPAAGTTKGTNVVQIVGTNFRLPPTPPAEGYLGGESQKTVSVKFEGVDASWAEAATDSLILATVPQWVGAYDNLPLTLDVRVANLDDAGVEIVGENVTSADAYTISRVSLAAESFLQRVCRLIIATFRTHVLENTHMVMSRDYVDDTAFLERVQAELPVLYLIGPNTPRNGLRSVNRIDAYEDPGDAQRFIQKAVPITVDLEFDVRVYANNTGHALAAQQALLLLFRDVSSLPIDDQVLEFHMPLARYPTVLNIPNQSGLQSIRCGLIIKGVHIDEEAGTMIERGSIIFDNDGEPILDIQAL